MLTGLPWPPGGGSVHATHAAAGGFASSQRAPPDSSDHLRGRSQPPAVTKYTASWTALPTGIGAGRLSNAPLLGNGDLGISLGGSLPGAPQPPRPPPGGEYTVSTAECNTSDPRQLWSGLVGTQAMPAVLVVAVVDCTPLATSVKASASSEMNMRLPWQPMLS